MASQETSSVPLQWVDSIGKILLQYARGRSLRIYPSERRLHFLASARTSTGLGKRGGCTVPLLVGCDSEAQRARPGTGHPPRAGQVDQSSQAVPLGGYDRCHPRQSAPLQTMKWDGIQADSTNRSALSARSMLPQWPSRNQVVSLGKQNSWIRTKDDLSSVPNSRVARLSVTCTVFRDERALFRHGPDDSSEQEPDISSYEVFFSYLRPGGRVFVRSDAF